MRASSGWESRRIASTPSTLNGTREGLVSAMAKISAVMPSSVSSEARGVTRLSFVRDGSVAGTSSGRVAFSSVSAGAVAAG